MNYLVDKQTYILRVYRKKNKFNFPRAERIPFTPKYLLKNYCTIKNCSRVLAGPQILHFS